MDDMKDANLFLFPPVKNPKLLSPIVLAYVGDAIFEVYIRQYLISKANHKPHHLHQTATQFVSAKAQAKMLKHIIPQLSDEEIHIVKRGRNAKSGLSPKHTEVLDYRHSTAYECLIGYLYYLHDFNRLREIMDLSISLIHLPD
jgi:ribonuclease-3 family protein